MSPALSILEECFLLVSPVRSSCPFDFQLFKDGLNQRNRKRVALIFFTKQHKREFEGNWSALFQIESMFVCEDGTLSTLDLVFWRGMANPQSGEWNNYNDLMYNL